MYGNVLGASAIQRMVAQGELIIEPFEERFLGLAHYRLRIGAIYRIGSPDHSTGGPTLVQAVKHQRHMFAMAPQEYVLVESVEDVVLPEGMFAKLLPASRLIEQGLTINAGKVDAGHRTMHGDRQSLMLGLKNELNRVNEVDLSPGLVHIEFVDLRGTEARFGGFSSEPFSNFEQRAERLVGRQRRPDSEVRW